jgi:hypothetical protein
MKVGGGWVQAVWDEDEFEWKFPKGTEKAQKAEELAAAKKAEKAEKGKPTQGRDHKDILAEARAKAAARKAVKAAAQHEAKHGPPKPRVEAEEASESPPKAAKAAKGTSIDDAVFGPLADVLVGPLVNVLVQRVFEDEALIERLAERVVEKLQK